jgi:DNA/RNA endonuclease YhcR with UshA esterase domain
MKDHQIFQIAFITAILGLAGMIFFSDEITPQELKIRDIKQNHIGETIAIQGLIRSVETNRNNLHVLSVMDDTGEIKLIITGSLANEFMREGVNLKNYENKRAKIVGNVKEYKGSMELIAENTKSIKIIN